MSHFEILDIRDFEQDFSPRQKRTAQYYFIFIEKGAGEIQVDFYKHPIVDNILWLITSGRAVKVNLSNCKGKVITFDDTFLNLSKPENQHSYKNILFHYFCHAPFFELDEASLPKLKHLFSEIVEEFSLQAPSREVLLSFLKILLIHYQRNIKRYQPHDENNTAETIITLRSNIEQYYVTHKQASFYADKQHLSLKRLNEIVKSAVGKTVTRLIHERILLEIKRQLLFTDFSITEIAHQLNFEDANYLYRFFKKRVGTTPAQFRKSSK
ncbi:MAG: helix-turn-helix domain-containing protein [Thermonemataceae bacterium]